MVALRATKYPADIAVEMGTEAPEVMIQSILALDSYQDISISFTIARASAKSVLIKFKNKICE